MRNLFRYFILPFLFLFFSFSVFAEKSFLLNNNSNPAQFDQLLIKCRIALMSYDLNLAKHCIDSLQLIIDNPNEKQYLSGVQVFKKMKMQYYYDYYYLKSRTEIKERLDSLISYGEDKGYTKELGSLYNDMGFMEYSWYNNYDKALDDYLKLENILGKSYEFISAQKARIYVGKKEYTNAKKCYKDFFDSGDGDDFSKVSAHLGYVRLLIELNEAEQALEHLLDDTLTSMIDTMPIIRQADWLKTQATVYLKLENPNKAKELLLKGLDNLRKQYENAQFHFDYVDYYNQLCEVYFQLEEYDSSLLNCQLALANIIPEFRSQEIYDKFSENPDIEKVDLPIELYKTLNHKSKVLFFLRHESKYRIAFEATNNLVLDLVDLIQSDFLGSNADKQVLLSKAYTLYERGIISAHEQNNFVEAYQISERSKALNLRNALIDYRLELSLSLDSDDMVQLKLLQRQLLDIERTVPDSTNLLDYRNKKYRKQKDYNKLLQSIRENNPLLGLNSTVSIDEIRTNILADSQALIEYFVGDDYIFAFLIHPKMDNVFIEKIEQGNINKKIKILRDSIGKENKGVTTAFLHNAYLLYQELMQPFQNQLSDVKRLILIPDREFWNVPFNVLLQHKVEENEKLPADKLPFLIQDYSITYWFSVATAKEISNNENSIAYENSFLGVAPDFDTNAEPDRYLKTLLNVQEINKIKIKFKNPDLLLKKEATLQAFIEKVKTKYQIVHIASHADADVKKPMNSYVAFSNYTEEYKLGLNQLYNLRIPSELVVLSACKTGLGKIEKGEGAISLSRSLIFAGTQSVVSSMWQINDNKSQDILEAFYANILKDIPKDVALQKAQKQFIYLNENTSPNSWAAFAVYGNPKPISETTSNSRIVFLFGGGLMFSILFFLYKRRKSRSL